MTTEPVAFDVVLKRALSSSSLTYSGKPFHAVMEVGTPGSAYSGRVEAWWVSDKKYRIDISSPAFHQTKTANGGQQRVKTEGDYYPRWLENFVQALMDPAWMAPNFSGRTATSMIMNSVIQATSVSRDDRTNGITDQMTEGRMYFAGPDFYLQSTSMFNNSMLFGDWVEFGNKKIARTYETSYLDRKKLGGHLVVLEELRHPNAKLFAVDGATLADQGVSTVFIPTAQEEDLLEKAPDLQWPPVREGRTDGYMIVFARTDRTGQVRETSEYSSHNQNPGLEQFGMEGALKYKFKPLIVNGEAVQFETPLVLHFISRIDNPIPILTVEEMKALMGTCDLTALLPKAPLASGNSLRYRVSVDEKGVFAGYGPVEGAAGDPAWGPALVALRSCSFKPYVVNGQATYYKGDVDLVAR
jgi:hypothetical protein